MQILKKKQLDLRVALRWKNVHSPKTFYDHARVVKNDCNFLPLASPYNWEEKLPSSEIDVNGNSHRGR